MAVDAALSILIERNWFAQESYHRRKRQELLPSNDPATCAVRRALTKAADAAWRQTEADLWKYRAAHGATVTSPPPRKVRPVRNIFGSRK